MVDSLQLYTLQRLKAGRKQAARYTEAKLEGVKEGLAKKALDSVKEKLDTKYGVMILQPAYTRYHLELGEVSSYPPGYKENAGILRRDRDRPRRPCIRDLSQDLSSICGGDL